MLANEWQSLCDSRNRLYLWEFNGKRIGNNTQSVLALLYTNNNSFSYFVVFVLASAYFPETVSSAQKGLTSGFGMGPGGPPSLWTPTQKSQIFCVNKLGSIDRATDR